MSLISELKAIAKTADELIKDIYDVMLSDGPRVWLKVSSSPFFSVMIELHPFRRTIMDVTLSIGHTLTDTIAYLDQNGNPMLTTPTPDSPPVWSDSTPATETLTVAADGSSATGTPLAVGVDTVSLTVIVGGVTFSATQNVIVTAAPQVLTKVDITPTVN